MNTLPTGIQVFGDNVYTLVTGKFNEGKASLDSLCNAAIVRLDRKMQFSSMKDIPKLTEEQKEELQKFWSPYVRHMDDRFHRLCTYRSGGKFYPEYIPEDFYFIHIDRFYNDRRESAYMDNKCYYAKFFPHTRQPGTIAMRVGHNWLDEHGKLITREEVKRRIKAESEVVLKRAVFSEGGFGVHFISGEDIFTEFRKVLRKIPTDVIVQKPIRQHADMAALNPSSVNTLRIMSWLDGSDVKILCTAVRIGVGGDRVDNISHGGLFCGVRRDGSITNGFLHGAIETDRHPEHGYLFSEMKIPNLDKAYELVREAHPSISHFRIAGWDIAIDEDGEPVMIEVNFSLCCVNDIQSVCGPLFGDDTKKMLNEVFKGKKAQYSVLI